LLRLSEKLAILGSVSPEKWYSVKEVAGLLGFSRDTVVRQIRRGLLKAFVLPGKSSVRQRVYKSRRIQGSEVLRYVREHMMSRPEGGS
jgi:excisionase family DNA binding protein